MTPTPQQTVLVTDLVDSTRLLAALGDAIAADLFARHDRLARDLLEYFRGTEVDKSDGFLLLFPRPADAVSFALRYHAALHTLSLDCGQQLRARIGIQCGELQLHPNAAEDIARGAKRLEVEGLVKVVAARLMGLALPGQILLGASAFDQAQRSLLGEGPALGWLAHGRYRLKGIDEPLMVFEVGVQGLAPLRPPPDSDKAHRDVTEDERQTLGWRPGPQLEIPGRPHWRLLRKLGAGGFGEAWLAEHEHSRARRVFKFCHRLELLRSLKREVTVFRLLRDALGERADIARLLDWQLEQPPFYIESEYIDGGDLQAWAERRGGLAKVPLAQRLQLAGDIAEALAAAHSVGVLHKDIKPANVLVRDDGDGQPRARLTDFGIGKITDTRQLLERGITLAGLTELSHSEPTGGSQLYQAPEVVAGEPATVRSDLYAFGVVLYELACGEFKPLAPGWQRDIADPLLRADIAALVDGDPERRPADADAVAHALRAMPQRQAQRAADAAQSRRRADRHCLAQCLGLALLLFALLATGLLYSGQRARELVDAEIRSRLLSMAETVTVFVDPAVHKSFYEPQLVSLDDPTWKQYDRTFQRLLAQQPDFAYLYTVIREDGRYYFILDGTPEHDTENASALKEHYPNPDDSMISAFDRGQPVITLEPYSDRWGTFISAFVPLRDADGALYAVLGVDMHYDTYRRLPQPVTRMQQAGLAIIGLLCLLGGVLLYLVRRRQLASI